MIFLLHNIKEGPTSNYDPPAKVEAAIRDHPEATFTFDGVYKTVWHHRRLLSLCKSILFVIGGKVGSDNRFDKDQPFEYFCDWDHLAKLALYHDCEIGWHTWTHPDLTKLSDEDIRREITPPAWLNVTKFAYPYGRFNERVERIVAEQYEFAFSGAKGDDSAYQIRRRHL